MTLLTLLLISDPSILGGLLAELMKYAALLFSIYVFWRTKYDKQNEQMTDTIKKQELVLATQGIQLTNFQLEIERIQDSNMLRFNQLEKRVSLVDQVLSKVQSLEIRVEAQNVHISELKGDIRDLRAENKANQSEIIALIKERTK